MKKMNKKGFTLIELLAIIVILAIIAVITVPIILKVIDNAKKGAAKNSVAGYAKAIELAHTEFMYDKNLNGTTIPVTAGAKATQAATIIIGTGANQSVSTPTFGVNYDGDEVTCTNVTIDNGKLTLDGCTVKAYSESVVFKYKAGTVKATGDEGFDNFLN